MPELAVITHTFFIALCSHRKIYNRHHELVDRYGVPISTMKPVLINVAWFSFPLSSTQD